MYFRVSPHGKDASRNQIEHRLYKMLVLRLLQVDLQTGHRSRTLLL